MLNDWKKDYYRMTGQQCVNVNQKMSFLGG